MRFTRILLFASLLALAVAPVAVAIRFTDESYMTPVGYTGVPYSHTFEILAGGGSPPYKYRILAGSLPPGLTMNSDSGHVSGVPTRTGTYVVWIEGLDCGSRCGFVQETTQRDFTIRIEEGLLIVQRQSVLTPGFVGQPYSFQLTATGGGTPTWSLASGSLPPGLALNAATGLISGTPTQLGDGHFQIKVADGNRSNVQTYTLPVVEPLRITSPARAAAPLGRPVSLQLAATGGRAPYHWSATGLPAGLALNADTGEISGIAESAGSSAVDVTVSDAVGLQQTASVSIVVAGKLRLAKASLPALRVGRRYSARIGVGGGLAPRTWAVVGGSLPPGIALGRHSGIVAGVPTRAGVWRVKVRVTDATGARASRTVTLRVLR